MRATRLFLFLFCLGFPLFAYEPDYDLVIDKEEWVVAGQVFEDNNLESRHIYLISRFPELLLQNLQDCQEHKLSVQDRNILSRQWIDAKILQSEKSLDEYYASLDSLFFDDLTTSDREEKRTEIEDNLKEEKDNLAFLRELDSERIKMESSFPLSWKENRDEQTLYDADFDGNDMDAREIDYLVSGTISNFGGRLLFQVDLLFPDGSRRNIWEQPGSERDLTDFAVEASDVLRSWILGRAWSVLKVKSGNPLAGVYLDGELLGIGSFVDKTIFPETHLLEMVEEGYAPRLWEFDFEPWTVELVEVTLVPEERSQIRIITEPGEADIYLGVEWQGKSPIVIPRPETEVPLQVKREGYTMLRQSVGPGSPDRMKLVLAETEGDIKSRLDKQKDLFYSRLGWFTLSIGFPLIMNGISENYKSLFIEYSLLYLSDQSLSEYFYMAQDAHQVYATTFYATYAGIALSGGLLVDVLFKLFDYIDLAEESANS